MTEHPNPVYDTDMIDWLDSTIDDTTSLKTRVYPLDSARSRYEVRELAGNGYLVLNWGKDMFWLKFAVLERCRTNTDGTEVECALIFHGEGPTSNLRECRHTWWGEEGDGYMFYPNGNLIAAAFGALSEFFDDVVCSMTDNDLWVLAQQVLDETYSTDYGDYHVTGGPHMTILNALRKVYEEGVKEGALRA